MSKKWSTTDKPPHYSFERKANESGTSFLFGKDKRKVWSFEKKSCESGTAFLFNTNQHRKNFGWE
jgi:hypothetical protein